MLAEMAHLIEEFHASIEQLEEESDVRSHEQAKGIQTTLRLRLSAI